MIFTDYFMQVTFSSGTNIAILESPSYLINTTVCLQFNYSISSPKIYLNVTISTSAPPIWQSVGLISYLDQTSTNGSLQKAAILVVDGISQIRFVAIKNGITENEESVVIDDVSIVNGPCKAAVSEYLSISYSNSNCLDYQA